MATFLQTYWYLLVAVAIGIGGLLWVVHRSAALKGDEARFGITDYLMLWPLLLTKRENGKLVRRDFTRRERIGWGVVLAIMILAVILDSGRR